MWRCGGAQFPGLRAVREDAATATAGAPSRVSCSSPAVVVAQGRCHNGQRDQRDEKVRGDQQGAHDQERRGYE
jgi:hypothetical protein